MSKFEEIDAGIEVIAKYNKVDGPAIEATAAENMERSFGERGVVQFGLFVCPSINARLLNEANPELYILTSADKTTFEAGGRDQRVSKLFADLRKAGLEAELQVIIGDTDESDYIFPVLPFPELDEGLCGKRKAEFAKNLKDRVAKIFPWAFSIERYSEIAQLYDNELPSPDLSDPTTQQDQAIERTQMRDVFNVGGYFDGIPQPNDDQLREIVAAKFLAYAIQGVRLVDFYPNMVLIQNEFPLLLRTRMLNLLNQQLGTPLLPAIYPIGERNGK